MIFHRARLKKTDTNIPIILNNTNLEQVTFTKFLGVIIDDKLTFERHIVYTENKISKGLGIIEKSLDPLIKVQKKIVRVITFSPYLSHTDPIFRDLNILPFSKLVTQRIGVLMFKYSIHVLPNSIEDLFTSNISINSYNT